MSGSAGWQSRPPAPWRERSAPGRSGRARLLIDCYQPAAALRSLEDARASDLAAVVEVALLRAEAYRLLGRASHALGELQAATSAAGPKPTSDSYPHLAQIHQLRGVVLGEMLAVDKAEDSFQLAIGLWGEIGFSDGHPECAHLYHRFLIRDVGDLAAAAQVVRPVPEAAGELALRWNEDTDELFAAMKLPDRPQLTESQLAGLSPRQAARAIAARLAHSWPQYRHLLPALTDALGRIRPPSARLLVLDELRRCEKAVPADVEQLREAFEMTAPLSYLAEDAALQQGLLAELDRLRGSHALAGHEFDDSITGLPPLPAARLARWRWLQRATACSHLAGLEWSTTCSKPRRSRTRAPTIRCYGRPACWPWRPWIRLPRMSAFCWNRQLPASRRSTGPPAGQLTSSRPRGGRGG